MISFEFVYIYYQKREKARIEKMKHHVVPATSPEQREESFRRWLERKRTQNEQRKADVIMQKYRNSERREQERQKRQQDKNEKLTEWIRKKEEEMKCTLRILYIL